MTDLFPRVEQCPDCGGSGTQWWWKPDYPMTRDYQPCITCDGTGRIIPPSWLSNGTP